jgi:hypothetical protein
LNESGLNKNVELKFKKEFEFDWKFGQPGK